MRHRQLYDTTGRTRQPKVGQVILAVVAVVISLAVMGLIGRSDYEERVRSLSPATFEEASCVTSR